MLRPAVTTFLFTAIFLSFWAAPALAGQFTVEPIRVAFQRGVKTAAVTVRNQDSKKLTIQISAVSWNQDEQGKDIYGKSKSFLFFPRLATLAPNSERVVRIAYRGPPATGQEITHRLFIEELPVGDVPGAANTMRLTVKFSIPMFIEPATKVENWNIEKVYTLKGSAVVNVNNTGNSHVIANLVTSTGYDQPGGAELFKKTYFGWYVLPGKTLAIPKAMDREQCLKVRSLKMEVTVGETTKELVGQVQPDPADCPTVEEEAEKKAAEEEARQQELPPDAPPAAKPQ